MPDDLTPEEQQELENIRRRKQELLEDIQVLLELDIGDFVMFIYTKTHTHTRLRNMHFPLKLIYYNFQLICKKESFTHFSNIMEIMNDKLDCLILT